MNSKTHNVVFAALFLALIVIPAGCKALSLVGVDFPAWTGVGGERSHLEGRAYQDWPELSIESLASSEFQDDLEQYASDLLPLKDEAMLLNATLQRASIRLANVPFGYDVYPTFYDSDYVYDPDGDAVIQSPDAVTEELAASFAEAVDVYNAFAAGHGEQNVYFYRVERMNSSDGNPVVGLVSDPVVDGQWLSEAFFDKLGDEVTVIDGRRVVNGGALDGYFRTDHHWAIDGAYDAYSACMNAMGARPLPVDEFEVISWDDVAFYGSLSRSGLCLPREADVIEDYWVDIPGLEVVLDGRDAGIDSLDHRKLYEEGGQGDDAYVNRYAEYFHGDYGLMELRNGAAEGGTLLIVGDSFTNNMERFFALNYQTVLVLDPRHTELTVDDLLAEHEVDDVLFILGSTTMASPGTLSALR